MVWIPLFYTNPSSNMDASHTRKAHPDQARRFGLKFQSSSRNIAVTLENRHQSEPLGSGRIYERSKSTSAILAGTDDGGKKTDKVRRSLFSSPFSSPNKNHSINTSTSNRYKVVFC